MTYPHQSGFVRHSDTSEASAIALDESGRAGAYDQMILKYLAWRHLEGATAEEVRKYMNDTYPKLHNGTVNGRLSTLWRKRLIVKMEATRRQDSGKQAHVYIHEEFKATAIANGMKVAPEYTEAAGRDLEEALKAAQLMYDNLRINKDGSGTVNLAPLDLALVEQHLTLAGIRKG